MMRSLYSGVTGLRNHQTRMDVIGNNISNVNTVAYKASRVVFQDIFSQTISPATGANGTTSGGTNPKQVGLGSAVASIDILNTESATQYTGNTLDLAIEGDGYFTIRTGTSTTYTRAGNFYTDENDNLVTATGGFVQGYAVAADGTVGTTLQNITIDPSYTNVTIDETGKVNALDGSTKVVIAQIALATFSNTNALEKVGSNTYRPTVNSGDPTYSTPGNGAAGKLKAGALEMSNVDLASEFTDMIVTQRGFQANSRIITTTDSMLEELVNLKR